jgi:hypothetical protein
MSDTLIISHHTTHGLNEKIKKYQDEGYVVVGSHQVVETHHQNRYRGQDHVDTIIEREYSITLKKEV